MNNRIKTKLFAVISIILFVSGCSTKNNPITDLPNDVIHVVDMAGRAVDIPAKIDKVYATSLIGTIMLYTLSPEMIAGTNSPLSEAEKRYLNREYQDIPVIGTWKGSIFSGSMEKLLEVSPDVILNVGDIDEEYKTYSDEIQAQLGIPVLMVNGSIEKTAEAYEFLGKILDKEARAKNLGDYFLNVMNEVMPCIENISETDRVRLYYAEGPKGLQTDTQGTINTEIVDLAGAVNVAGGSARRIDVSMEQVLAWDPDIIIISTDGDENHQVYKQILSGKEWGSLKAVQRKNVYEIPSVPYDWINRPPSVNRIIGIQWLANLLYPDVYNIDIKKETKSFFKTFYSYELSDEEVEEILEYSTVTK